MLKDNSSTLPPSLPTWRVQRPFFDHRFSCSQRQAVNWPKKPTSCRLLRPGHCLPSPAATSQRGSAVRIRNPFLYRPLLYLVSSGLVPLLSRLMSIVQCRTLVYVWRILWSSHGENCVRKSLVVINSLILFYPSLVPQAGKVVPASYSELISRTHRQLWYMTFSIRFLSQLTTNTWYLSLTR